VNRQWARFRLKQTAYICGFFLWILCIRLSVENIVLWFFVALGPFAAWFLYLVYKAFIMDKIALNENGQPFLIQFEVPYEIGKALLENKEYHNLEVLHQGRNDKIFGQA
jgi:hypothetical protein